MLNTHLHGQSVRKGRDKNILKVKTISITRHKWREEWRRDRTQHMKNTSTLISSRQSTRIDTMTNDEQNKKKG